MIKNKEWVYIFAKTVRYKILRIKIKMKTWRLKIRDYCGQVLTWRFYVTLMLFIEEMNIWLNIAIQSASDPGRGHDTNAMPCAY